MKRKFTKILSCILCITTIVTSIPFTSNAERSSSSTDIPDNTVSVESQEAVIVSEMEGMRSADAKTYLLSDGSYLHAIYPEPVHYRENNEWVDVDNGFETATDDDGDKVLENKKNSFKIRYFWYFN